MTEDDLAQHENELEDEFEIDTDGDLESAMQEALEAVEKASQGLKPKGAVRSASSAAAPAMADADIVSLEEEIAELRDRSARTLADFENFRKRVDRERVEDRKFAAFDIMKDFLAVVDNLERALAADSSDEDLKVGVELIHRQMKDLMKNVGVECIAALGEEFDPRFHEAVTYQEDSSVDTPVVSAELQTGYLMHNRLLRPSVVKVTMPPEDQPDEEQEPES